jgi:hypothetical protein
MRFKVYLLRKRGRRLAWRDVQNGPRYVGQLVSYAVDKAGERYTVLALRPDDPVAEPAIPDLYEPVLLLEAEVAVILNAGVLDARNLYVAMTRGSKAVTVCAPTPILNPAL